MGEWLRRERSGIRALAVGGLGVLPRMRVGKKYTVEPARTIHVGEFDLDHMVAVYV